MNRMKLFAAAALVLTLLAPAAAWAVPNLLQYQGRLTDASGNNVANGSYSIVFRIYGVPTGGSALYTETQAAVTVANGLFNVVIGSVTTIPATLFDGSDRYLGITVGADPEMAPRQRITSVGYALRAGAAEDASGLASNGTTNFTGLSTTGAAIDSVNIAIPTAGQIVVEAGGNFYLQHVAGPGDSEAWAQVNETRGSPVTADGFEAGILAGSAPSGRYWIPFHSRRVFSKAAGTYRFYLNTRRIGGNAGFSADATYHWLQATFYPQAYGPITIASEANAPASTAPTRAGQDR